jgi:hypothetical protein
MRDMGSQQTLKECSQTSDCQSSSSREAAPDTRCPREAHGNSRTTWSLKSWACSGYAGCTLAHRRQLRGETSRKAGCGKSARTSCGIVSKYFDRSASTTSVNPWHSSWSPSTTGPTPASGGCKWVTEPPGNNAINADVNKRYGQTFHVSCPAHDRFFAPCSGPDPAAVQHVPDTLPRSQPIRKPLMSRCQGEIGAASTVRLTPTSALISAAHCSRGWGWSTDVAVISGGSLIAHSSDDTLTLFLPYFTGSPGAQPINIIDASFRRCRNLPRYDHERPQRNALRQMFWIECSFRLSQFCGRC